MKMGKAAEAEANADRRGEEVSDPPNGVLDEDGDGDGDQEEEKEEEKKEDEEEFEKKKAPCKVVEDSKRDAIAPKETTDKKKKKRKKEVDEHKEEKVETKLFAACREGRVSDVRQLVRAGARINSSNWEGETPLHAACRADHRDVVKLLVENGALIDAETNRGFTPIEVVEDSKRDAIGKILQEQSAKYKKKGRKKGVPDKEFYKIIRMEMQHEDELIERRLQRCLVGNSFLVAGYALLAGNARIHESYIVAMGVISTVGLGFALSTCIGLLAAYCAMFNLMGRWHTRNYGDGSADHETCFNSRRLAKRLNETVLAEPFFHIERLVESLPGLLCCFPCSASAKWGMLYISSPCWIHACGLLSSAVMSLVALYLWVCLLGVSIWAYLVRDEMR